MGDFCRLCGVMKDLYNLRHIDDSELLIDFKLNEK